MICTDRRLRLSAWLIAALLCFIWGNSLLPGWISESLSIWVRSLLAVVVPPEASALGEGDGLLRKIAHFAEFAALGACLCWRFGMLEKRKILALIYSFGAACLDETIQMFVPERGPGLRDVAIDTCGAAAGIGVLLLGHTIINHIKQSKEKTL